MSKNITILVALLAVAATLFGSGYYSGRAGLKKAIAEAQTKQLRKDVEVSNKIEDNANERKKNTQRNVMVVRTTESDWATRRLPDSVTQQLRDRRLAP